MSQEAPQNTPPRRLTSEEKKAMALDALSGKSITETAQKYGVSRNAIYAQKHEAETAIHHAFSDKNDSDVLFYLPVSKPLISQMVLGMVLICKASYRDVIQWLHDIMGYSISIGNVAGIVDAASYRAAMINVSYDLRVIHDSAADEAFHRHHPILAVVDIDSRFCALLEQEDQRDAESWGVHLLDMIERGFQPTINISDQAAGLKKAFDDHLPKTTLRFDHFHLIKASKDLVRFLKNRKDSATTQAIALYERKERADKRGNAHDLDGLLRAANFAMAAADSLHKLVDCLCTWLQYDVLQLPGSCPADREELFDFIVDELRLITDEPRIQTHVRSLIYQKDDLLAVAHSLAGQFQTIADQHTVSIQDIWEICYTARFDIHAPTYHFRSEDIEKRVGPKYDQIEDEVLIVIASTHRCSSIVENFNSRLRPYIDERKTLTKKTLGLYQFILNHRPFQRSYHPHLVGKTPAEALTGKPHPHWLELLGYQRFKRTELAA